MLQVWCLLLQVVLLFKLALLRDVCIVVLGQIITSKVWMVWIIMSFKVRAVSVKWIRGLWCLDLGQTCIHRVLSLYKCFHLVLIAA